MIRLPKLPTGHVDEWIEIDHAELQRIQREAMRAGIEAAAKVLDKLDAADRVSNYHAYAALQVRALRIEGEQP